MFVDVRGRAGGAGQSQPFSKLVQNKQTNLLGVHNLPQQTVHRNILCSELLQNKQIRNFYSFVPILWKLYLFQVRGRCQSQVHYGPRVSENTEETA